MHEFKLMQQIVRMVNQASQNQSRSVPAVVRLRIGTHSHLAEHTTQELETIFRLAAQGTPARGAKLDILKVAVNGNCRSCGMVVERTRDTLICPTCQSGNLVWEDQPEVLLNEIEYIEERA